MYGRALVRSTAITARQSSQGSVTLRMRSPYLLLDGLAARLLSVAKANYQAVSYRGWIRPRSGPGLQLGLLALFDTTLRIRRPGSRRPRCLPKAFRPARSRPRDRPLAPGHRCAV